MVLLAYIRYNNVAPGLIISAKDTEDEWKIISCLGIRWEFRMHLSLHRFIKLINSME